MQTYQIGSDVICTDGKVGKLIKVAIDPHTKRVTDLVVEKGFLLKEDRVVPAEAVARVTNGRIELDADSHEITDYPQFRKAELAASDPKLSAELDYQPDETVSWALRYGSTLAGWEPVRPQLERRVDEEIDTERPTIGRGTRVYNEDETIGAIDHLLVNVEDGHISHLVVQQGLLPFRAVVPVSMIEQISREGVLISASRQELKFLEHYTPRADKDIVAEVRDRLNAVRDLDLSHVRVSLVDGLVRLFGSVTDVVAKREAHTIAENVSGVIGVEDEIVTDEEVQAHVVAALLADEQTGLTIIDVSVTDGVVILTGDVDGEQVKEKAEAIAGEQPGVQAVVNQLSVE